MNDTMKVKEVAARLQLSMAQVYGLIDRGLLPCRRLGINRGKILVDRADVEAYWEASKVTTPREDPEPAPALRHLRPFGSPARRRA